MSTIKNYPQHYKALQACLKDLTKVNPRAMKAFEDLHQASLKEGQLSTKVKELIALSIAVAVRCDGCIAFHVAAALKAGATRDEIAEALQVTILMGGGPAVIYSAQALEAVTQFEGNLKEWAAAVD